MLTNRVTIGANDVLIYKGKEIGMDILDAILDTNKRLLWAFVQGSYGDVQAVAYSEERVIWMSESDVQSERDIEV